MGNRAPVYPLFLWLVGAQKLLCPAQLILSVLALAFFGWTAAALPGVILAVGLSLAPTIWQWDQMCLSESLSLSLCAVAWATTLRLSECWSRGRFWAWVISLALFGLVRDLNLLALPFLGCAVAWCRRRRWLAPMLVVSLLFAIGLADTLINERGGSDEGRHLLVPLLVGWLGTLLLMVSVLRGSDRGARIG